MSHVSKTVDSPTLQTRVAIIQSIRAIEREMTTDPPHSVQNAERRGELDQLRDMLDRRRK